ncbi:MAG: hypothetical protein E7K47_18925, partial [Acidovorax sp.]|nr:hypothetical protein [Acidovorax sp.]
MLHANLLVGLLGGETGPHQVHQELGVAVVSSRSWIRASGSLARNTVVVAHELIEELVGARSL